MKKNGILTFIIFVISSCHGPLKVDYEFSVGKVLGKYKCSNSGQNNFWIIDFVPSAASEKNYGTKVNLNGEILDNVVLTSYDLSKEYKDSTGLYYFSFHLQGNEDVKCSFSSDSIFSIPKISVLKFTPYSE